MDSKPNLEPRRFGQYLAIALILVALLIACGGGGGDGNGGSGSADATSDPTPVPSTPDPHDDTADKTDERIALRRSMTAMFAALAEEAQRGSVLQQLSLGDQMAHGLGVETGLGLGSLSGDDCVTLSQRNDTLILSFDGTNACDGLSGTWEITPAPGNDPDGNVFASDIELIDFSTGNGCLINGEEHVSATLDGSDLTAEVDYDLDVCGQRLTGQVMITGENPGQWVYRLAAQIYTSEDKVRVLVEVDWYAKDGALSADGEITLDGETHPYRFQADNIVMDPGCGLPTGGSLSLSDDSGATTSADFADTSCEVPMATVVYEGETEQWALVDRPRG